MRLYMHPKPQEFGISLKMSSEKKTYEIIIVINKKTMWE
jgi:hypothetical protein